MKKVVSGKILKEKMQEAVNLLCDSVKMTLGPGGNNAIIDHSSFSPFITNDGVTIAQNIESDDEVINTILELAKEASIKTNEKAGDGTTTTLVLLQSIFNQGLKLIEEGLNPIILKNELINFLPQLITQIQKHSYEPTKNDYLNIATSSANDETIGKLVSEAFTKIKNKEAIIIKESDEDKTTLEFLNGYTTNITTSIYYFQEYSEINYENPNLLIVEEQLEDIEQIAPVINDTIQTQEPLIIIASDYTDQCEEEVLTLNLSEKLKIILLKIEEYGLNKNIILEDLKVLINDKNFGKVNNIKINKEQVTISFTKKEKINAKIKQIKAEKNNEFNQKRLAMFENGLAFIMVGATTSTERREIKMRVEDALCSITQASTGVCIGSGLTYYQISQNLTEETNAQKILRTALKKPFEQIIKNSGLNYEDIILEIKNNNYQKLYNVKLNCFENINKTKVIDATNVIINALSNAISIASMLLTTNILIINEYQNNSNKINDFSEF